VILLELYFALGLAVAAVKSCQVYRQIREGKLPPPPDLLEVVFALGLGVVLWPVLAILMIFGEESDR
jgi:hypothetical protein